jgi:hypothetical protein
MRPVREPEHCRGKNREADLARDHVDGRSYDAIARRSRKEAEAIGAPPWAT